MTPARQLTALLADYSPSIRRQARACLATMRKHTPGATEMLYTNYRGVVIGFSPNDRPSDAIFSLFILDDHISLCFLQGAHIPDPDKLLRGSGNQVRHIRLESDKTLLKPAIRKLIRAANRHAEVSFDANQKRSLVVRSISARRKRRSAS